MFSSAGLVANDKRSNLPAEKLYSILSELNICNITSIWNSGTEEVVDICVDKL